MKKLSIIAILFSLGMILYSCQSVEEKKRKIQEEFNSETYQEDELNSIKNIRSLQENISEKLDSLKGDLKNATDTSKEAIQEQIDSLQQEHKEVLKSIRMREKEFIKYEQETLPEFQLDTKVVLGKPIKEIERME